MFLNIISDEVGEVTLIFNNPQKGDVDLTLMVSGASSLETLPSSASPLETNPDSQVVSVIYCLKNLPL